jgi:acetyltransferase-like isoleucine patch superfamily enzyme
LQSIHKTTAIKPANYISSRFKGNWSGNDKTMTLARLALFFLRGCYERIFFAKASGMVLIGRGASIRYAKYLEAGKDLIVEDYAEVNCLSKQKIILGDRVTIGKFAIIRPSNIYGGEIGEGLKIGNNSNIGPYSYIGCSGYIEIGDNVMISPRVSIYAENHVFDRTDILMKEQGVHVQFVKIENDCWIAANSIILAGVTIGKGSVIAAGSVVTKDVPPFSIAAGVPAKVIASRK